MILSILTFILGVVGSYLISRNFELKTQIRMNINSFGIINKNIGIRNVVLECNGTKIDILTKTSIMFWNSGRKCIVKDEILGDQYLKIEFPQNTKIFACKNIKNNEKLNNIFIYNDQNTIIVKFDYLKPGNGAIIDILHNGDMSKEIVPILNLKTYNKKDVIKVNKSIDWESIEKKNARDYQISKIFNALLLVLLIIIASVSSIFLPMLYVTDETVAILTSLGLEFICGGLFILLLLYLKNSFYLKPKDLLRKNEPKENIVINGVVSVCNKGTMEKDTE